MCADSTHLGESATVPSRDDCEYRAVQDERGGNQRHSQHNLFGRDRQPQPQSSSAFQLQQQHRVASQRAGQQPVQFSLEQSLNELYQLTTGIDPSRRYQGVPKRETFGELVSTAFFSIPLYPLAFVKTLIQVGHEPVEPQQKFSWLFGRYNYYYPGLLGYSKAIIRQEGWTGLFRGVKHNFLLNFSSLWGSSLLRPLVCWQVNKVLGPFLESGDVPDTEPPDTMRSIATRGSRMLASSLITSLTVEVLIHPFKVITVRCISQAVGHETAYSGIWSSIREVYQTEGIRGFYSGLVPALLGHTCAIFIHTTLWLLFEVISAAIPSQIGKITVKVLSMPMLAFMPASYAYPFFNVSTHMMVNNVGLAAGLPPNMPVYVSWMDCFRQLKASGHLYRGSSNLFSRFAYEDPRV